MNKIPKKLREDLASDTFYKRCSISGDFGTKEDPIEWHHNLIYAGKQVQAKFAILPLKKSLHANANNKELRAQLDWIMWNRATPEEIQKYSKVKDYQFYLQNLNVVFGMYVPSAELSIRY